MVDALTLNIAIALAVFTAGVALLLALVSALSYARLQSIKLLFPGMAFSVLAVAAGRHAFLGYRDRDVDIVTIGLDFLLLSFLYLAIVKR